MSIFTPVATLSYPHLFEPHAIDENSKAKYGCALVFPPTADLTEMKRAAVAAAKDRWGAQAEGMIRNGKLRMPFRTDAEVKKGYPEGCVFMNVRSDNRPGIVSRIPDPTTGRPMPIVDPGEVYPGAQVKASLGVFAYDVSGNKGVSFGLRNLQKWGDGERLDNFVDAADEFEADPNMTADLSDLEAPVKDAPIADEDDLSDLI